MTEHLIASLLAALNAAGIPAYREYPAMKMPCCTFFVTAAAELTAGKTVPFADGTAAPVKMMLRLRYHCKPDADFELLAELADETLFTALTEAECDIQGARREALHYNQTLDKNVCETIIELHGMLRAEQEADNAAT
ncbi:MAG: hypothetical protein IKQ91_03635 [Oscillospiraceae bacterium]|nr:hypothetical protein [Oscillospiraceae bacterium]